jgi:lipoprotein-anchoring transpeptidase ErfK/SrfK
VITTARGFYEQNDRDNGDRFYLLALQKSRIIEMILKAAEVVSIPEEAPAITSVDAPPPADPGQSVEPYEAAPEFAEGPDSSRLVGSKGSYTVVKADSIPLVAAKLGVSQQHLRRMNGLDTKAYLKIGQQLVYDNRKIIPRRVKDGIIINIPDRTLYYFQQGVLVASLPVALGSATKNEKYVWQTPVGKFRITAKMKDPTWTVPISIQTEMEEQGKEVLESIPPGPENPLGKYAIKTSIPGILIHSTIKPSSIYSFSSHGCIRISPERMEDFFPKILIDTRGEIIYQPVKLAVTGNGRVLLEVHHDVYKKSSSLISEARQMIENQKLSEMVDWEKFKSVVKQKSGVAEDISLN